MRDSIMKRSLQIIHEFRLVSVVGLVAPTGRPQRSPMDWTLDGRKRPPCFRWSWHPPTAELYVGVAHRHVAQLPRGDPTRPFDSFLRAFLFYPDRAVALRPYWWPVSLYEPFDTEMNGRVLTSVTRLLRPMLPNYRFHLGVDNEDLAANFARYASSW
jgi:hypothetical protein